MVLTLFLVGFLEYHGSKTSFNDTFPGGQILTGGSVIESEGNFVQPTIIEISPNADVVKEELCAPVLYVLKFQVSF